MTEREWLDIFRRNLTDLMQDRGYNITQLAEATDLSVGAMSYYIRGLRMPGVKALLNIAYELDVDVSELVDFGDRIEG